MSAEQYKIPKKLKHVAIWVHPIGHIYGAIYVRPQSDHHNGEQEPREVLNDPTPFLVLRREESENLEFINKNSIVRVDYEDSEEENRVQQAPLMGCHIRMMDGAIISGHIRELLPPDKARIFDYLNQLPDRFLRLFNDDGSIALLNKNYIVQVTLPLEEDQ